MAARFDIALNADGDLAIRGGDFYFGPSDQQHVQDTINAWPGWWKEFPLDGVAVGSFSKSGGKLQVLARKLRIELNSDGYQVDNPTLSLAPDGTLLINPNATRA